MTALPDLLMISATTSPSHAASGGYSILPKKTLCECRTLRCEGDYYADRTDRIRALEQTGKQLLFLRPRGFGKTAWLTTLESYYDLAGAGEFDHLLEFKYLSLKDLGQTGEQLRALPREALAARRFALSKAKGHDYGGT